MTAEDVLATAETADQHTGYNVNDCSRKVIDDYLVDPVRAVPANGATC